MQAEQRILIDHARSALAEITATESIGEFSEIVEDGQGLLSIFFVSQLAGYRDWRWFATVSWGEADADRSVLEVGLLPGETSLLAPEWVAWADRPIVELDDEGFDPLDDDEPEEENAENSSAHG